MKELTNYRGVSSFGGAGLPPFSSLIHNRSNRCSLPSDLHIRIILLLLLLGIEADPFVETKLMFGGLLLL